MPLDSVFTWLDALRRDPAKAVGDLLSGHLDRGQFARLDPAEFMQRALAQPGSGADLKVKLDEGLQSWLGDAMVRDDELRHGVGLHAHLYRINEALAGIKLLELPVSAKRLAKYQSAYRRWLQRYDYGFGDGPYAGYWRTLAVTQSEAFRQQWFDFVVRAGEQAYPRYLFHIGMSGLRHLPLPSDERLLAMLNALLLRAWRLGTEAAAAEFAERLSALRAEFPMGNDAWRGRVLKLTQVLAEDVAARTSQGRRDQERLARFSGRLSAALKPEIGDLARGKATAESVVIPEMPSREEFDRIKAELRSRQPMAVIHALDLFENHRRYAETSGDSYFFVRTLCNLGHRVLKQDPSAKTLESLREHLRHALAYEPANPFPWSFWVELEQAAGRDDVAELVLWEAVRRFPNNAPIRVELALTLQRRHAREGGAELLQEAERLLREAVESNPQHEPSRLELALLLQRRHAHEGSPELLNEAEKLLRDVVEFDLRDEPSRVELALLLQRRHIRERSPDLLREAERLLREVVRFNAKHLHSRSELARLLGRTGRGPEACALLEHWLAGQENQFWLRLLEELQAGKTPSLPEPRLKGAKHKHGAPASRAAAHGEDWEILQANAASSRFVYSGQGAEAEAGLKALRELRRFDLPRFVLGWYGGEPVSLEEGVRLPYALSALAALASRDWDRLERDYSAFGRDSSLLKLYAGAELAPEARLSLQSWLETPEEGPDTAGEEIVAEEADDDEDSVPRPQTGSYEDFFRRRLRQLDFLGAAARHPDGLATPDRSGEFDQLFERHLARTIEADWAPLAL
jgi:cytochrome c-type biogenesis protein CcmH/NrfG